MYKVTVPIYMITNQYFYPLRRHYMYQGCGRKEHFTSLYHNIYEQNRTLYYYFFKISLKKLNTNLRSKQHDNMNCHCSPALLTIVHHG